MFTISVRLVHGVYEATSNESPDQPEWPPHPARLFAGLLAVADGPGDLAALDWLEAQGAPTISASPPSHRTVSQHANWVVTNETVKGKSHMEFSGRAASGKRTWTRVAPRHHDVAFHWPSDPGEHAAALEIMTRRLPYLGRSTTPVVATLRRGEWSVEPDLAWSPDDEGTEELSVPHAGFRAALSDAFDAELRPWTVARRWQHYRIQAKKPAPNEQAHESAFSDFIVFAIEGRARPSYQSVVRYTTAFRNALIKEIDTLTGGAVPVEVHGHVSPGEELPRHRVMFLGLPFVGSDHADGHLLGFAVCVPRDMSAESRTSLYRGLLNVKELFGAGQRRVELTSQRLPALTLRQQRWTQPARAWVSAYPLVLDRHVSRNDDIKPLVRSACRHLDLPEPLTVDWSPNGLIEGTDRLRPNNIVRRNGERARPAVHVLLTFKEPIAGPVVLGNMRHLGLGLMLPIPGNPKAES